MVVLFQYAVFLLPLYARTWKSIDINSLNIEKQNLAQTLVKENVVTNGTVNALTAVNGLVYIAGTFTQVGKNVGSGVPIDTITALPKSSFPKVNNTVRAVISDGAGGWFIGGDFTLVGGLARNRLAHILSDGTVDPLWAPNVVGNVYALAKNGSVVYVGGSFSSIDRQTRFNLAAIDVSTGGVLNWNAGSNGTVWTLRVTNSTLYVGGEFYAIGGQLRNKLAAIDLITGNATAWDPNVGDGVVLTIETSANKLFAGGYFHDVGGQSRSSLVEIDLVSGVVSDWNPNQLSPNTYVYDLELNNSTLYVVGTFNNIYGESRNKLAAFNIPTGELTSWNPNLNVDPGDNFYLLKVVGDTLYIGGSFNILSPDKRTHLLAVNIPTAKVTAWNPKLGGRVYDLAINGSTIYAGGRIMTAEGEERKFIAAVDASTGDLTSWNPGANNVIYVCLVKNSKLYVGGNFTEIGGYSRNKLASFDITTGEITSWNPNAGSGLVAYDGFLSETGVLSLAVDNSTLYAGGLFPIIGGQSRNNIAAFDISTGELTNWNPGIGGTYPNVHAIVVNDSTVYIGGDFTSVGGQTRNHLAAVDKITGTVLNWNPNVNEDVFALALNGTEIYLGGWFTAVGGQSRSMLASVELVSGSLTSWAPFLNNIVQDLRIHNSILYVGGFFTSVNGQTRNRLAAFDLNTHELTGWNPNVNGGVNSLEPTNKSIYVGGDFTSLGSKVSSNFAELFLSPQNQSPTTPVITSATVNGINATNPFTVLPGQTLKVNFSSNDPDISDVVSLFTPLVPVIGTFTPGQAGNPATASFIYTAPVNPNPTYTFTVSAVDNHGTRSDSDLLVVINIAPSGGGDDPPSDDPPGASWPPGMGHAGAGNGQPPGQGGSPPGHGGNPPGQGNPPGSFPGVGPDKSNDSNNSNNGRPEGGRPEEGGKKPK